MQAHVGGLTLSFADDGAGGPVDHAAQAFRSLLGGVEGVVALRADEVDLGEDSFCGQDVDGVQVVGAQRILKPQLGHDALVGARA